MGLVEEVYSCPVTADVEVVCQIPTLLEPHLRQIPPSIVPEQNLATWFQDPVDIAKGLVPLLRIEGRKNKDEHHNIDRTLRQPRRQRITLLSPLRSNIPYIRRHILGLIMLTLPHNLHSRLGKITRMDPQPIIPINHQQRKRRIPRPSPNLQHDLPPSIRLRHLGQHRKLLPQPLPILEEVGRVVLIEQIPPFRGVRVEAPFVEFGDGRLALLRVLCFRKGFVVVVGLDVVPGVEFEDVVAFFEVALAELEGVGAFGVVGGVVGAVWWGVCALGGGGDVLWE